MHLPPTLATALAIVAVASFLSVSSVAHAGESVSPELLREAIASEARRNLPDTVVETAVHGVRATGSVDLPPGAEPELRVRADGDEDWIGPVQVDVQVRVNGNEVGTLRVRAEVAAYVEVVVLRQAVSRGTRIRADDISLAKRDAAQLPSGTALSAHAVAGRVSRKDLGLNSLVRDSDLEAASDAQRGTAVTVLVLSGSLRVSTAGVLRQDGAVGDLVEVLTLPDKKSVFGVLRSSGLVEVPLSRRRSPEATAQVSTP